MDTLHDIIHSIINHFIPHEGNDYRPHLLQKAAFFGLVGMVVLSFTIANFQALLWQSSAWLVGAVLPAVVIDLTNAERVDNQLATLVHNPVLDAAATLKAQDMAKGSYFSHNSPTGVTPWHWFDAAGYSYVYAGENLAVFFTDSTAVVEAWMKSPTHRANIVGSNYREIGVGTAKGKYNGYDTVFVVQLFGAPAKKPTVPVAVVPVVPEVAPSRVPTTTVVRTAPVVSRQVLGVETVATTAPSTTVVLAEMETVLPSSTPASVATVTRATDVEIGREEDSSAVPAVVDSAPTDLATSVVETSSTMVQDTFATDDFVAVQSGMATSQTNLEPAPVLSVDRELSRSVPAIARLATEPHRVLQTIYLFIGIFTMFALFASVIIEWREHRPVQTVYGLLLLALMCGLFVLHTTLTTGVLII